MTGPQPNNDKLHPTVQELKDHLAGLGVFPQFFEFSASTKTAAEAANQIGCSEGQIGKSIIFRAGDEVVLIITSGTNRVDAAKVGAALGSELKKADADFVREKTGYAIGGVPPILARMGEATGAKIFIDRDLFQYEEIWVAAGTPNSVFRITAAELERLSSATPCEVK